MRYKNENIKPCWFTTTVGPQCDVSDSNFTFQLTYTYVLISIGYSLPAAFRYTTVDLHRQVCACTNLLCRTVCASLNL